MKGSTGSAISALRNLRVSTTATPGRSSSRPTTAVVRCLSTSSPCRDTADAQASGSSSASASASASAGDEPIPRGAALPGESEEEAFRRNLREVQAYRRRRDAVRIKTPFIPPASSLPPNTPPPQTEPTPLASSLSHLLATGAALGHATSMLHPHFRPYTYGSRAGLSIIDLDQTLPLLRRAAALVRDVVKDDGVVLFVGSRGAHAKMLKRAGERLGDNGFVVGSWVPGLLTNSETLFGTEPIQRRAHLPDLVVFLNPVEVQPGLRECTARNVPSIGIVDSNVDPRLVTYPIPANVESVRTAELILGTLSLAGKEGRRLRLLEAERRRGRQAEEAMLEDARQKGRRDGRHPGGQRQSSDDEGRDQGEHRFEV